MPPFRLVRNVSAMKWRYKTNDGFNTYYDGNYYIIKIEVLLNSIEQCQKLLHYQVKHHNVQIILPYANIKNIMFFLRTTLEQRNEILNRKNIVVIRFKDKRRRHTFEYTFSTACERPSCLRISQLASSTLKKRIKSFKHSEMKCKNRLIYMHVRTWLWCIKAGCNLFFQKYKQRIDKRNKTKIFHYTKAFSKESCFSFNWMILLKVWKLYSVFFECVYLRI